MSKSQDDRQKKTEYLAELLVQNNLLSPAQIELALTDVEIQDLSLEEVLFLRGWVKEEAVYALAPWLVPGSKLSPPWISVPSGEVAASGVAASGVAASGVAASGAVASGMSASGVVDAGKGNHLPNAAPPTAKTQAKASAKESEQTQSKPLNLPVSGAQVSPEGTPLRTTSPLTANYQEKLSDYKTLMTKILGKDYE